MSNELCKKCRKTEYEVIDEKISKLLAYKEVEIEDNKEENLKNFHRNQTTDINSAILYTGAFVAVIGILCHDEVRKFFKEASK